MNNTSFSFKIFARVIPVNCRIKLVLKTVLPDRENHMILSSFVLTQYRRVTDRQTDSKVALCYADAWQK